MVLLLPFHHIQTLEDVDYVIHPPPFDFKKSCHILQIQDDIIVQLEVLDESLAQELQAFSLPIVCQYLVLQQFLLIPTFWRRRRRANHPEDGLILGKQLPYHLRIRAYGVSRAFLGVSKG